MRLIGRGAVLLIVAACAKILPPPGGPPDIHAPILVATRPDSTGIYPGFDGNAEFIFDETVSEGSSPDLGLGNGDLERQVVLSPTDKVPRVSWERSRIAVRPRDGWRPNTVYRIELLPGIVDLRKNLTRSGQVITFSTGAPLPTDSLSGILVDWGARQPARLAMVEAVLLPDSLIYRTQSDSTGRFRIAPLPHGSYLLRGYIDQNKNRRLDGREASDTSGVSPEPAADRVLWLAPHDTTGPRIAQVTYHDSLSIEIQLSQLMDPYQQLDSSNIRLLQLPDSMPVRVNTFRSKALDDSLTARTRFLADSLKADSVRQAHPDTSHRAAAPVPEAPRPTPSPQAPRGRGARAPAPVDSVMIKLIQTRPALSDRLVLRVPDPFPPQARYVVQISGIRNVNGVPGTGVGGFTVPKPPPPRAATDSTARDSTARTGAVRDSTAHDSTTAPPPRRP